VKILLSLAVAAAISLSAASPAPAASKIQAIVSPGGIKAWLVREPSVPMVALDFAFTGGANADPAGKPGVANMVSSMLDEGAGDLNAQTFQERMEEKAIEIGFTAARDQFRGSLRSLSENLDEAVTLLRLALTVPRFDAEAVERIRSQMLAELSRSSTNPNEIANRRFWATAFPDHPYGRPSKGTPETVSTITADDLKTYVKSVFAREQLTVGIVGDLSAEAAGKLIDRVFGDLPGKPTLAPVPGRAIQGLGERIVINLDVPQTVINFGGPGVPRGDPRQGHPRLATGGVPWRFETHRPTSTTRTSRRPRSATGERSASSTSGPRTFTASGATTSRRVCSCCAAASSTSSSRSGSAR